MIPAEAELCDPIHEHASHPQPPPGSRRTSLGRHPELLGFLALLILLNYPVFAGSCFSSLIFEPEAVRDGQWWRLFSHPFVHLTWYHLLLDGTAFLALYYSLEEVKALRRLAYVFAGAAGSLFVSYVSAPMTQVTSLCGLSGIAHGLMAVSALEMMAHQPRHSAEYRVSLIGFILVISKAAFEALTGRMFFAFLDFGLLGNPVAVSHAGGIIGALCAMLCWAQLESQSWHLRTD